MISERIRARILELYNAGFIYIDIISQIKKEFNKKIGIGSVSRVVNEEKAGELNAVMEVRQAPKTRIWLADLIRERDSYDGIKTNVKYVPGKKRASARSIDPINHELNAENLDLAQKAHKLGLEESIARSNQALAKIREEEEKNKIAQNTPAFTRGINYLCNRDPTQAKAVLASVDQRQILLFNWAYSKWTTENLLVPLLNLIEHEDTSISDTLEIIKMMRPDT